MAFKLLKDVNTPGVSVPAGTVGHRLLYTEKVIFQGKGGNNRAEFITDYMLKFPDYFAYTESPTWTDEDMVYFANKCQRDEPLSTEEIRELFAEFIKTRAT